MLLAEAVDHWGIASLTIAGCLKLTHSGVAEYSTFDNRGRHLLPGLVEEWPLILRLACQVSHPPIRLVKIGEALEITDGAADLDNGFIKVVLFYPRGKCNIVAVLALAEVLVDVGKDFRIDKTVKLFWKLHDGQYFIGRVVTVGKLHCHVDAIEAGYFVVTDCADLCGVGEKPATDRSWKVM